jgi:uncharacterized membrane protein (DUF485 family)
MGFILKAAIVALASIFPKFKFGYGLFFIISMQLLALLFLFAAWADNGNQAASVVRFEIFLAIGLSAIGWVLGSAIMRQAERSQETSGQKIDEYLKDTREDD